MTPTDLQRYRDEALAAIRAHHGERYVKLDGFEAWVETRQYAGRQDWFHAGDDAKPLVERAPCVAYPVVKAAIDSHAALLLGEGRRPTFEVSDWTEEHASADTRVAKPKRSAPKSDGDSADESADDDTNGGKPAEVAALENHIRDIAKQTRFWTAAKEVFREALGCGSSVSLYGARRGRLFIDTVKAKWCTVERDSDDTITRLEIKYPYYDKARDGQGREIPVAKLYRRVIDDKTDTTFLPAKADREGREPAWTPDPDRTFDHGLGHCPVVWYASMRGTAACNQVDGHPIHEHARDEIFALDCSLSQRHRAALMAGDPQWTEIGVDEDEGPAATGRTPDPNEIVPHANPDHFVKQVEEAGGVIATPNGGLPHDKNRVSGYYGGGRPKRARKKGPGEVWRYSDPEAKVELHSLPGDALKAIDGDAQDLRAKVAEYLAVVFMDPESVKFAASLSGKALKILRARQLDRVDEYRDDFGDNWIIPQMLGLLRVVMALGKALKLRSAADLQALLQTSDGLPDLDLLWGEYFENGTDDWKALAEVLSTVLKAKIATREQCVKLIMRMFGDDDARAILEALDAEQDAAAERDKAAQDQKDKDLAEILRTTREGAQAGLEASGGGRGVAAAPATKAKPASAEPAAG